MVIYLISQANFGLIRAIAAVMPASFTAGSVMRSLMLLAVFAGAAHAGPTLGTLMVDSPLRASPKADGVETGTITRGTSVIVHHEEGDWLAVQPPRGSVSWISHLFIEFPDKTPNAGFPKNAVVHSEGEVKLAVGKAGLAKPLDVRKSTVPEGTIVLVIGPAVKSETDRTTWYPIVPPEDDFRYLPKSAVQYSSAPVPGFIVKTPPANSTSPPPPVAALAGSTPVAGKANWPNHPLWLQAEQAEQTGDLDKAEKLYFQLAKEMNAPGGDGDLANLCYSRVHAIRERRRQGTPNGANWTSTPRSAMPEPAVKKEDDFTPRDRSKEQTVAVERPAEGKGQWSGSGYLRIAGFKLQSKQAYALEDARGRLLYYAVASSGFDLERYRNKTVDLFGTISSPKDLRGISLMEVSKVDQVR